MKKTLGTLCISFLLLALPATALGQEQQQQQECQLQPSPEATAAQQFLTQAQQDSALAQGEQRELFQRAWEQLREPIESGTDDATLWVLAAQAQLGLRNYDRADQYLNRFVELRSECASFAEEVRYSAWARLYNQAIEAYQGGATAEALTYFVRASNIYKDARSLVNAGTLYRQQGQLDSAAVMYEQVLDAGGEPERVREAVTNLVQIRREQGSPEEALAMLRHFMAENPEDVGLRINYAQTLAEAGQEDSAQAIYTEMMGQIDQLDFEGRTRLGVGFYQAQNFEMAAEAFQAARELNPMNKEAMENLGSSLVQSKQFEAATAISDTLARWYPHDNQNLSLAVRAFSQAGDSQRAQDLLDRMKTMPVRFHQLGMATPGEGTYAIQGVVENVSMDQGTITLAVELLDENGDVVDTRDLEIELPAQGERTQFQTQFQATAGAVTFRYGEL